MYVVIDNSCVLRYETDPQRRISSSINFFPFDPTQRCHDNKRSLAAVSRVNINPDLQDGYDRIRPQGGRSICAFQSLGGEYRRDNGKGDSGTDYVSERRGSARRTIPFLEGSANSSREAFKICGLFGKSPQKLLNQAGPSSPAPQSRRALMAALKLPYLLFLFLLFVLLVACGLFTGCGHKARSEQAPPPPPLTQENPNEPSPSVGASEPERIEVPAGAKPIFEETGTASWYGAPYHNRRGSNGEVYNMNAMTAAHLTLPLGSIVRITNLKTNNSSLVRITDRGPFVPGRIVDLSLAAAKALDVYIPGTAQVRLEVLRSPVPLDTGGRWAVQIGAFKGEKAAIELSEHLRKRYQTAKVVKFRSPVGTWWVRVRVLEDSRQRATTLARETETAEGSVFLVRLD